MYEKKCNRFYVDNESGGKAFLITAAAQKLPQAYTLKSAWGDEENEVSFVYTADTVSYGEETVRRMILLVEKELAKRDLKRGIFFLDEDGRVKGVLGHEDGQVQQSFELYFSEELYFRVSYGASLLFSEEEQAILLTAEKGAPCAFNLNLGDNAKYTDCRLYLGGKKRGCFAFLLSLSLYRFMAVFTPGFQTVYQGKGKGSFAFFSDMTSDMTCYFEVTLHPADMDGSCSRRRGERFAPDRTSFTFTESNQSAFCSRYRTVYGKELWLRPQCQEGKAGECPARFVLAKEASGGVGRRYLAAEGEFVLEGDGELRLLCGLEGTELVIAASGDRLKFCYGFPAGIPQLAEKSPEVGEEYNAAAPILTPEALTSWCAFHGLYVAQPRGLALYGEREAQNGERTLLEHRTPGVSIPGNADIFVPWLPYGGGICDGFTQEAEHKAVAQERKRILSEKCRVEYCAQSGSLQKIATPAGQIVELSGNVWKTIYLGENSGDQNTDTVYFEQPQDGLVQAFQSAALLLVAVNDEQLGACVPNSEPAGKAAYHCAVHVQDWFLSCQVGQDSCFNHYQGVMIVKGCKGKLYDAENEDRSLITNMALWNQKKLFSSPVIDGREEEQQQPVLARWLLQYFRDAKAQKDGDYFSCFNRLVGDAEWQGVLFLNVPLEAKNVPQQIAGVLKGVPEDASLHIHHWGFDASTVKMTEAGLAYDKAGSVFGLIHYQDKALPETGVATVPPGEGEFDFRLLSLKVLFESSTVKKFECYSQLTLNRIFHNPVSGMGAGGNPYNTLLLKGRLRKCGDFSAFELENMGNGKYFFSKSVFRCVCLNRVRMVTLKAGEYGFQMDGRMDFIPEKPDLLSFGTSAEAPEETYGNQGLSFTGLFLEMVENEDGTLGFGENMKSLQFDLVSSQVRPGSLYASLAPALESLTDGQGKSLKDLGYVEISSPYAKASLTDAWLGLECNLALGTVGDLAGKAGFSVKLLIAFTAGTTAGVRLAMKLPGSKETFLNLQNLIQLSVKDIRLGWFADSGVFYLLLTDIALKFLGVAKIPSGGSLSLYLYGTQGQKQQMRTQEAEEAVIGWYAQYLNVGKGGK